MAVKLPPKEVKNLLAHAAQEPNSALLAGVTLTGNKPYKNSEPPKRYNSIKAFFNDLHDQEATGELLTAFRRYWPDMRRMTMREAWLRVVYLEAIAGEPWASNFIADRTEGRITEGGSANDKGSILRAIEEEMEKSEK